LALLKCRDARKPVKVWIELEKKELIPMASRNREAQSKTNRIPSTEELVAFYRAIGISAVASAVMAQKMTSAASPSPRHELPAFLRDAHVVG
jgi:hypothetical protein